MKGFLGVLLTLALVAATCMPCYAGDEDELVLVGNRDAVISALMTKLSGCDKCEVRQAAFALGENRCTEAVIPLLRMLHDGEEQCRIVAALALSRLGDARGTYAVKQAAHHDENPKVRLMAAWFYEQYAQPGTYVFIRNVQDGSVQVAER